MTNNMMLEMDGSQSRRGSLPGWMKYVKWAGIVFVAFISVVVLAGIVLHPIGMEKLNRTYSDIPVETVNIPTDPDAVARGRDVSVAQDCGKCHGDDLSGMLWVNAPVIGTFSAPNLTSGEGGIGSSYTDIDWVRAIRHGVKPNGQVEVFMYDYSTLSDSDLGALIAYLEQIPPVDSDYPTTNYGAIFPVARGLGLFAPVADQIDHTALSQANRDQ